MVMMLSASIIPTRNGNLFLFYPLKFFQTREGMALAPWTDYVDDKTYRINSSTLIAHAKPHAIVQRTYLDKIEVFEQKEREALDKLVAKERVGMN
jgi:hypothetical protein